MDAKQAFEEFNKMARRGSANSRSRIFAERARQAIANAYERNWETGEWSLRETASAETVAKANELMAMGVEEAVYGRGRALLH